MTAALMIVGISPNGGVYAWHSIQMAMNSVTDAVAKPTGAWAWF